MTYNVHQHWDPLRVCAVGRSYPPEFYSFIENSRVRSVMERIAIETEEDYQKLITLLESFGVEIVRTDISSDFSRYLVNGKYIAPPMCPRDWTAMIGDTFYMPGSCQNTYYNKIRGAAWPTVAPQSEEEYNNLPVIVRRELTESFNAPSYDAFVESTSSPYVKSIENLVKSNGNKIIYGQDINTAMTTRVGKDLYFGTEYMSQDKRDLLASRTTLFPDYRCHVVNTGGHADSTYCPVVPGLIISLFDIPNYTDTFPGWEVIYLPGQSWDKVRPFLDLKEKNRGKWWVPGEERNDDFTEFVEGWLSHWVGYVEETVFDVNMLVIDEKNVVCNNYNKKVFDAFERHGVTPHIVNFRHRYFWDGGLHCITSDLHREGVQKDYFPERG